jgi:hypothetical protein
MSVGPRRSDHRGLSPVSRRAFLGTGVKLGVFGASFPLLGAAGRALQPTDQTDSRETAESRDRMPWQTSRKVADVDSVEADTDDVDRDVLACGYCNGPGRNYEHCDGMYCDYIDYTDNGGYYVESYSDACGCSGSPFPI